MFCFTITFVDNAMERFSPRILENLLHGWLVAAKFRVKLCDLGLILVHLDMLKMLYQGNKR